MARLRESKYQVVDAADVLRSGRDGAFVAPVSHCGVAAASAWWFAVVWGRLPRCLTRQPSPPRLVAVRPPRAKLIDLDRDPVGMCGSDFGILLPKQFDDYGRVIREANVKPD